MTQISALTTNSVNQKGAIFNAVNIKINNPKTEIPEEIKESNNYNGTYNAVNIEIDKPRVETQKQKFYDYPTSDKIVTYDMVKCPKVDCPICNNVPLAYNLINNKTFINAEFEFDVPEIKSSQDKNIVNTEAEEIVNSENNKELIVPEANFTTLEAEKNLNSDSNINFNGIAFKAQKPKVEIVPPEEIKPQVDINAVVKKLTDKDYDIQAQQMEEIARLSMQDSEQALPYVVADVFTALINIVEKDTSNLSGPTEEQKNIRKQIIVNELVKEDAKSKNPDIKEFDLPYNISEKEIELASKLSPLEQAERNKEYGLYTTAILAKVYADEVEKETGNIVPMTDMPGISSIVDTLRYNSNFGVKIAAIDALRYIQRDEYKEELNSIFALAAKDSNPYVARNAVEALVELNSDKK